MVLLLLFPGEAPSASRKILKRTYRAFTLWMDCERRHGAVAFYYELGPDRRDLPHDRGNFGFDPKVPAACQPQSWRSYRTTTVNPKGGTWDRGLLAPGNHMDNSKTAVRQTYYLTNTLPRNTNFNEPGGAWHHTELISECYREISLLKIWGGLVWGNNKENDFFTVTHGIETPDFWWKVIYRTDKKSAVAWLFPNHHTALASKIDQFAVSIDHIKETADFIPEDELFKSLSGDRPAAAWPLDIEEDRLTCEGRSTSSE
ncbi:MAG: DNA/RNA non-specific endonuclease [Nitrospiria bacterium]